MVFFEFFVYVYFIFYCDNRFASQIKIKNVKLMSLSNNKIKLWNLKNSI